MGVKATLAIDEYYVLYDPETARFLTHWGNVDFTMEVHTTDDVLKAEHYVSYASANNTLLVLREICKDPETKKRDVEIANRLKVKEIQVNHSMFLFGEDFYLVGG